MMKRFLLAALLASLSAHAQEPAPAPSGFTLKVQTDLVLTDVVVRDRKTGAPVRGLTRDDFTLLENGKLQRIAGFDAQDVDRALQLPSTETVTGRAGVPAAAALGASAAQQAALLRDHRLIVLFFDTTSLQPDDLARAQQAARDYIQKRMENADLVSVVSLGGTLSLDQDFTTDKARLLHAVDAYSGGSSQPYAVTGTGTANQQEDATAFTADQSDYNDLNTDRELFAIASIARALGPLNQKKSLLYFSGGLQRDGIENQASLRATINAAVRNNLSIYSVDARGLQAVSPLGDASTGSLRGNAAYTGGALQNNLDANFNSQEVLATLSSDTGGKAFFDNNDFAPAFAQVQNDTASYYVLGFRSTDTVRDGRYRKLEIRVNRPDVRLSFRPGYYAPADYRHATGEQRERDLEAALAGDLPEADLSVYLQPFFFREATRTSMPVALLVPGAQIPFKQGGDRDKATLDVIGNIKDAQGHVLQQVRDTVKLALDQASARKNIQYATGFTLPAGTYHLKFVVRENETGKLGSFETDVRVPDLGKASMNAPLKLSSVVLASQRLPVASKKPGDNPLVYAGQQYVPNLPHVFTRDQQLYFFYEVYDPARYPKPAPGDTAPAARQAGALKITTSIELLRGNVKVFESPLVDSSAVNLPGQNAIAFAFAVPLSSLADGTYTCQVNVIDDAGGAFAFPRTALSVRGGAGIVMSVPQGSATAGKSQ